MAVGEVLRRDVAPLAAIYVVFVVLLVVSGRRLRPVGIAPGRQVLVTVLGGYVLFGVVASTYGLLLAGKGWNFVGAVFTGGLTVLAVAVPGFVLLGILEAGLRRLRRPGGL